MMAKDKRGRGRERTEAADYFRFLLRMPEDMAREIDAWAKEDYSPMNAYILRMLRDQSRVIREQKAAEEGAMKRPARRVS